MGGAVAGCYKTESGDYVEYETVSEAINGFAGANIFSSIITAIDEWGMSTGEADTLLGVGIVPPFHNQDGDTCGVDADGKLTSLSDRCKAYLKDAVKYMRKDNDYKYDTYTPYIEKVEDHWYRDVYFVADKDQEFVDYDYDYEAIMRERWTLYETYGTDSDKMGEYKLYALKEDGNYATSESEIFYQDENKKNEAGNVYTKENGYMLYSGTYDDAKKLTISVAKKPVTVKIGENYEDLNWNEVSNGKYTAYSTEVGSSSDYQQLYHAGDDAYDDADEDTKKAMEHIYSKVDIGDITQTGEGQRGATNPKIKKMFLENRYFVYNGDKLRAEAITAMRNKEFDYGPLVKSDGTPYTLEELEEKTITLNKDGDEVTGSGASNQVTFTAKDLSGNVSINQESLDAFTMLENTHTLDADYIYRDFKELIVELGYFEKDELTDETPRVMEFPVPEIGSGGFPNRTIDKIETENGTMIHSKGDIDANEKKNLRGLLDKFLAAEGEGDKNGVSLKVNSQQNKSKAEIELGISAGEVLPSQQGDQNSDADQSTVSSVSADQFIEKAREICEYMDSVGYDYCVIRKWMYSQGICKLWKFVSYI